MTFSPFALTWFPQISESGIAWVLLTCLRFLCLFIKSTTRDMEREMAADMEDWRGNFGNEIIKQCIVHERDIFLATVDIFWVTQTWVMKKLLRPNGRTKTQFSLLLAYGWKDFGLSSLTCPPCP